MENRLIICVLLIALILVLYSPCECYLDETDLEQQYSYALIGGGLVSGTVFDARPRDQEAGLGWIL